jgi:hypothetical protein
VAGVRRRVGWIALAFLAIAVLRLLFGSGLLK